MDVNGAPTLNGSESALELSSGLSDGMESVNHADDEVSPLA